MNKFINKAHCLRNALTHSNKTKWNISNISACFNSTLAKNDHDSDRAVRQNNLKLFLNTCKLPDTFILEDNNYSQELKSKIKAIFSELSATTLDSGVSLFGLKETRKDVAKYIESRDDNMISYWQNVYLTLNSNDAIKSILQAVAKSHDINSKSDSWQLDKSVEFLIPNPSLNNQWFSTVSSDLNTCQISYNLNRGNKFDIDLDELTASFNKSASYCIPKVILFTNPNDLTGHVYSRKDIENLVRWSYENNLIIIADEKNQTNLHNRRFDSFKKVSHQMGPPFADMVLASTFEIDLNEHNVQACFTEVVNMSSEFKAILNDSIRFRTSSNLNQLLLSIYLNDLNSSDLNESKLNANFYNKFFKNINGIEPSSIDSGSYALLKINLPSKVSEIAKSLNLSPIEYYCSELLKATKIFATPYSKYDIDSHTSSQNMLRVKLNNYPNEEAFRSSFQKFHVNFNEKLS